MLYFVVLTHHVQTIKWDWRHTLTGCYPISHKKERAESNPLPTRISTWLGARVAPQRCPILRAGIWRITCVELRFNSNH